MNILYLTFYFEPDLCAGSFRNTAVVQALAKHLGPDDHLHVITTQPNRYATFRAEAPAHERQGNVLIDRVALPNHRSGLFDQARAFWVYYKTALLLAREERYDLVVASSSRLFTAALGARLARQLRATLFLDIRDIFRENLLAVLKNPILRLALNPALRVVERYTFGQARHINIVSEGFRDYFQRYSDRRPGGRCTGVTLSFYPNGIDAEFLNLHTPKAPVWPALVNPDAFGPNVAPYRPRTIVYAGNIGEGQALHQLIPEAARQLGPGYQFVVVGDGGAVTKLRDAVQDLDNVALRSPVARQEVAQLYAGADYLLLHLAPVEAFERVLPSKIFEYAATDKPLLAGVNGYARRFLRENVDNCFVFDPADVASLVKYLRQTPYRRQPRPAFVARFRREGIAEGLVSEMLRYVPQPELAEV